MTDSQTPLMSEQRAALGEAERLLTEALRRLDAVDHISAAAAQIDLARHILRGELNPGPPAD